MVSLFSPLPVKQLTFRNRIVMPPMGMNQADERGAVTEAHMQHYASRAAAGVGLVIVEHTYIRPGGQASQGQLGIYDDALILGLRRLAEAIKAQGSLAVLQITHGGGRATRAITGSQPLAPSDGIIPPRGVEPARALTIPEMEDIVQAFAAAARRAVQAGFDGVEVHGAHGYLLSEFLSPLVNRRTDEYGGSLANRLRMPLRVVEAVHRVVDAGHLLLYRLGADDLVPGGLTQAEGCQAAHSLAAAGVDVLDVSGGLGGDEPPGWDGVSQGYFVPMAAAVRAAAGVPVIGVGGIKDPRAADRIIRAGQVDLVAVGRAMLTNPHWAAEARAALG
jgi:2,4-dienoyl-CoA reductase-like NADH-dependent reductase (Old Yellow Enzyme family)